MRKNYEQLERQFREKTAELQQMNAQLKLEIKERICAEEAFRLCEERLEKLTVDRNRELEEINRQKVDILESISDCFYALDKDLRFIYANKAAEEIWGLSRADLIGRKIEDVFVGLINISLSKFRQVLKEQIPQHYEVYSKVIQKWGDMSVYPTRDGISVYFRDTTERKKMEGALRHSEEMFAKAFEHNAAGMSIVHLKDGKYIEVNNAWLAMYCYRREDVVGRTSPELDLWAHENDRDAMYEVLRTKGYVRELELFMKKQVGENCVGLVSADVITMNGEEVVLASVLDITERKRAEDALRKSEECLAADLEAMTFIQKISTSFVQNGDFDSILSDILKAAINISGAQKGTLQLIKPGTEYLNIVAQHGFEQNFIDFFSSASHGTAAVCAEAFKRKQRTIVEDVRESPIFVGTPALEVQLAAGVRAVQSTPLVSRNEEMMGILSTHWDKPFHPDERILRYLDLLARQAADIIERKLNEEKIKAQNLHLEALISVLSECSLLSIVDKNENYLKYSNLIKDYYFPGIKTIDKAGGTYRKGLYFDEMGNELSYENIPIRKVLGGERISAFHFSMKTSEGVRYFVVDGIPVFDEQGKINIGILVTFDITEQVEKDKSIRNQQESIIRLQQEKNDALLRSIEMKDEFLSIISHEFKTPLTVINSAVQAMRLICRDELSEKGNKYLSNILQNSNRLLKLVNNLLDITRINAGRFKINRKNIDIIHSTRSIIESIMVFAEQKDIRLTFSSTLGMKVISIDEEKYERILLNLLSNAIKFTTGGKSILVRASQKIVKEKCKVCIQVKDQGIGISQDNLQLIFERFGQVDSSLSRQAEGTGIGLSLVKMLVEIMDGEIGVESEMGKGSTFTVFFPVTKIKEKPIEKMLQEINDNRLILATAIEFSDIY